MLPFIAFTLNDDEIDHIDASRSDRVESELCECVGSVGEEEWFGRGMDRSMDVTA